MDEKPLIRGYRMMEEEMKIKRNEAGNASGNGRLKIYFSY